MNFSGRVFPHLRRAKTLTVEKVSAVDFSDWHPQTPRAVPNLLHPGSNTMRRVTVKIGPAKLRRDPLDQLRDELHCLQVHFLLPWKGCIADHHPVR